MDKYKGVEETSRKTIMINNFIGGLFFALGSTVGLAIIIALLTFILSKVNLIPFLGSYLAELNKFIMTHPK
jgi:hypothetical protein